MVIGLASRTAISKPAQQNFGIRARHLCKAHDGLSKLEKIKKAI